MDTDPYNCGVSTKVNEIPSIASITSKLGSCRSSVSKSPCTGKTNTKMKSSLYISIFTHVDFKGISRPSLQTVVMAFKLCSRTAAAVRGCRLFRKFRCFKSIINLRFLHSFNHKCRFIWKHERTIGGLK